MGSVVKVTSIYNTNAGNKSVAFGSTCAAGNTIAVFASVSTLTTDPTISDDQTGGTYTAVGTQTLRSGSGSAGRWYIRNAALASTVTPTVTMTSTGDAGGGFVAIELTGVSKVGTLAVRAKGNANNQASGGTPGVTLDQTPLTTSIILGGVISALNSTTTVTPPTSFTERFDNGFNTPASGMEVATRDSGHTSTAVTWGSTLAAAFGVTVIEIDTTAPAGAGHSQPHFRIRSDDTQTINANAGWAANLDTNATIDAEKVFRLRFDVSNSTASEGLSYKLQYRRTPNGGSAGAWTSVPVSSATPPTVREAVEIRPSGQFTDQAATTQVISTGTFVAGVGDTNQNTGAIAVGSGAHTELEWPVRISRTYGTSANGTSGINDDGDTFEFRVVSTNNDIFGGTYVNPTITLNVPDGLLGGTYAETPGDLLFQDANQNLYFFMEGADTNPEPFMMKSTDNGVSWFEKDHANRPGVKDYEAVDIAQATTELFVLHQASNNVYLHSFRTSNNASPDTWNIKAEAVATPSVTDQFASLVRRSDGTLVAFYSTTPSGSAVYTTGYKVRSSGGVWGTETLLDSTANVTFTGACAVVGESDITYIFYVDSTNGVLYMKTLSAANVLSARTQIATGLALTAASQYNAIVPSPRYYVQGGNNNILVAYVKSDDKLYSTLLINGSAQTERAITSETVQVDSSGTTSRAPAAGLDVSTLGIARLIYSNASNGDIYMRWAPHNGAWSGLAVLLVNPVNVTGFVSARSYPDSGTLYTGVVYDTAGGYTGEIKFFPVVLGVKTHTTDGYVSAGSTQVTKTHTTNALVKATLTKTHTSDALVKATLTKTHTTNAIVKATLTKTHTTDALVKATLSRTHTSDALVKATLTRTHTTNAIVLVTATRTHTSDAFVRATFTRTHTTNSIVRATLTKTHTTDAYIPTTKRTHTTDAIIRVTQTRTHTSNAIVLVTATRTHTTNAYVVASFTRTHTTDAFVRATFTRVHTTDATLRKTLTRAHTTDAYIPTTKRAHTTDAVVRATFTRTHTSDALIRATLTRTHTTNAIVRATLTRTHTTDALLKATLTRTHTTDAVTIAVASKTHSTDALVRATLTLTQTADAVIIGATTRTHTTDALVSATSTRTHTTDAVVADSATPVGIIYADGFEIQNLATAGFNGASTTTKPYSTSTNNAVNTANPKHGAACLQVNVVAAAASLTTHALPTGTRTFTESFYIRFDSALPTANVQVARCSSPNSAPGIRFVQSSGRLRMDYGQTAGTEFGPVLAPDTWYLVDWKGDVSTNTFSQSARVDGGTTVVASTVNATAGDIVEAQLGNSSTSAGITCTILYDDWVVSINPAADFPLGEHAIVLLKPVSDGTHNGGTNIIEDSATGTDIVTPGFTTAWTLVNEVPPDSTDYILQTAAGSGNYAEVVFDTPPYGTAWGTSYIAGLESNTTGTFDLLFRLVDSSGTTLLDQGGSLAGSSSTFRKNVAWVNGDPTGRKGRIGFATDVTPKPRATLYVGEYVYVPPPTKTHTTDALVQKTLTQTHTTDAFVQATFARTHTTDAVVAGGLSTTHTTDAIVRATFLRTHSTDAVVPARLSVTHTTNAVLRATLSRSHTTNAVVRATLTRTHTTDAIVRATLTRTHTTNALVKATLTRTHSTDAYLFVAGAVTLTHTTNAIVRATLTRSHTSDALVLKTAALTHTTNAIVRATATRTHTTNALIRASLTRTHTTDALVRKTLTATHTTNALVYLRSTKTHTTNAFVLAVQLRTHTTNAVIRATLTRQHSTDADIKKTLTRSHLTDTVVGLSYKTAQHFTDAYIIQPYPQWPQTLGADWAQGSGVQWPETATNAPWIQDSGTQWPQGG